jgi:DNA uptake protein ComE-like DNA-binding protein
MEEPFRQKFKEYFYFLKKDRNGILVLVVLILLAIAGHFVVDRIEVPPDVAIDEVIEAYEAWEKGRTQENLPLPFVYFNPNTISAESFDSIPIPQFIKRNIISYRSAGGSFSNPADIRKIYGMTDSIFKLIEPWLVFAPREVKMKRNSAANEVRKPEGNFDPNTADADELYRFGFNNYQVSNIVKYRERGGSFKKPEDVLKIYGVDSAIFLIIQDYIQIEEFTAGSEHGSLSTETRIDLNEADSLDLVQLNGIGPVFASRIIKYRNLLGGYYTIDQLREVYGFPEKTFLDLRECFETDTLKVKKLRINFAEYSDLLRHPYLKKEQVKAILDFRTKNGPYHTEEQLLSCGLIDSVTYRSMKPYLTCR